MPGRLNHYFAIHKALRQMMFESSLEVARTDFAVGDYRPVLERFKRCMYWLHAHSGHEDRHIHTALEACAEGCTQEFAEAHQVLGARAEALEKLADQIAASEDPGKRTGLGAQLQIRLNALIGEYLVHMSREETHGMAMLWAHFDDEQLMGIVQKAQAAIPPGEP